MSSAVKPIVRQYGDGVSIDEPCLINEERTDNTRENKNLDVKLVDTYPSCSNNREGISLEEVEWEIPWEDLQIGGRIGIGKNICVSIFCKNQG